MGTNLIGFITDHETKVDMLNTEAIAKTIVQLIIEANSGPLSIGVHGDWGAGKSSVLEMIEDALEKIEGKDKDGIVCLKFNGWQFQGFEDAKIAVIESIINELIDSKSLWNKAKDEVTGILQRIDWLKVAKKAGGLALTAYTSIPVGLLDLVGNLKTQMTGLDAPKIESAISEIQGLIKKTVRLAKASLKRSTNFTMSLKNS